MSDASAELDSPLLFETFFVVNNQPMPTFFFFFRLGSCCQGQSGLSPEAMGGIVKDLENDSSGQKE